MAAVIIIFMKKFFDSDWLRAVQFQGMQFRNNVIK